MGSDKAFKTTRTPKYVGGHIYSMLIFKLTPRSFEQRGGAVVSRIWLFGLQSENAICLFTQLTNKAEGLKGL